LKFVVNYYYYKMKKAELKQSDYKYWKNFCLWIHKDFTPATIDEAEEKEFYCVIKRCADRGEDYWGYLNNKGEEVKVIWKK